VKTFSALPSLALICCSKHLKKEKVGFSQRRANGQALFQLFLYDPNGIKIELNYATAEAEGIEPELMASDLIARA
jgi:hypothetical protein